MLEPRDSVVVFLQVLPIILVFLSIFLLFLILVASNFMARK